MEISRNTPSSSVGILGGFLKRPKKNGHRRERSRKGSEERGRAWGRGGDVRVTIRQLRTARQRQHTNKSYQEKPTRNAQRQQHDQHRPHQHLQAVHQHQLIQQRHQKRPKYVESAIAARLVVYLSVSWRRFTHRTNHDLDHLQILHHPL